MLAVLDLAGEAVAYSFAQEISEILRKIGFTKQLLNYCSSSAGLPVRTPFFFFFFFFLGGGAHPQKC